MPQVSAFCGFDGQDAIEGLSTNRLVVSYFSYIMAYCAVYCHLLSR